MPTRDIPAREHVIHSQLRSLVGSLRGSQGRAAALLAQKIHQGLERRRHLATAWIIKKKSCRRSWRPLVENSHKPACCEIPRNEDWRRLYQREAFDNDLSSDGHRIDAEPALDVDFKIAAFDAKAPGNIGAAWKSDTHAVVPDKIVWRLGFAALLEISRRTGDDERKFVGDAHRNHVAFNPLAEANA